MRSKLACLVFVLALVACGESRERVGSNHLDGALAGGGALASSSGGGAMATSAGGSTDLTSSTNPAGGASAGGTTSPGGSLATSSASGGTGPGGTGGLSATGGRGGTAGATGGGSTLVPDAGASTGGKPQLDAGTPVIDGSAQADAALVTNPDAATGIADTGRADSSADGQTSYCHSTTTGCMCTAIPSTEPSVSVCNNDNQDETRLNRCCAGSSYCVCDLLACAAESSSGRCTCDFEGLLSNLWPTWTKVARCPTRAAGFKCCLFSKESYCECKQQECTGGSTEVADCVLSDLAPCAASETPVDSCK